MMKMIFMLLFLIPLSFKINYWIIKFYLLILMFMLFFNLSLNDLYINISYNLGYDLLSFSLIMLSLWICMLMLMASDKIYKEKFFKSLFVFMVLVLLISLIMTFASMNLFIFYLFFEISLIPTLMLILGWGNQPERIQAGLYLLFYTLMASLPMIIMIFKFYIFLGSLDFFFLSEDFNSLYMYLCVNMVFFIKMPMYLFHLWLPKAHVEAPIAGSMILAGIMLKLGGYGLMRLMILFMSIGMKINYFFMNIALMGGVIVSLVCIRQSDMKSLIAYSSVAHMGMVLGGIMSLSYWGLSGALIMMLAHGLCSSGMFCLANLSYERMMSRSLYLNKGLINLMPSMSMWWFLFCSSNMAAPPSFNLLGEIILINSIISFSVFSMLLLMLISFFSAVYSLYLYSYSQHGKIYSGLYMINNGEMREYLLMFLHWIPLNILVLSSNLFML